MFVCFFRMPHLCLHFVRYSGSWTHSLLGVCFHVCFQIEGFINVLEIPNLFLNPFFYCDRSFGSSQTIRAMFCWHDPVAFCSCFVRETTLCIVSFVDDCCAMESICLFCSEHPSQWIQYASRFVRCSHLRKNVNKCWRSGSCEL